MKVPILQATARGENVDTLPAHYAGLINRSIASRPDDMAVCVHLCRGNAKRRWFAEGGYEPVAEVMCNDMLLRRIEEAASYCSIDQLCLSPQCGFASVSEGNEIKLDVEKRKLDLIVEVAEEVWGA